MDNIFTVDLPFVLIIYILTTLQLYFLLPSVLPSLTHIVSLTNLSMTELGYYSLNYKVM